ncbi:MAG: chemotaxis protein CheW [Planctomycetota bacterium]|nr:chemotaxis protein CheW [Planctomycetota bacterium]
MINNGNSAHSSRENGSRSHRGEVARWLEAIQSPESADLPPHPSLLFFRHAGTELALPATVVGSVEVVGYTHRVPHRQGPILRGLASTKGDLVPLVDLTAAIGLDVNHNEVDRVPRLIVLCPKETPDAQLSLIVDLVHGVELSDPDTWRTPDKASTFVKALVDTPRGEAQLLETTVVLDEFAAVFR